jgi:voltage-gated potassium channel
MVPFFPVLRRFVRALGGAWRSDEELRVLVLLAVCLLANGTIFDSIMEKWSVLDAIYFSVMTLITVGLGYFSLTTILGKLFTVLDILIGLDIIGEFINILAENTIAR